MLISAMSSVVSPVGVGVNHDALKFPKLSNRSSCFPFSRSHCCSSPSLKLATTSRSLSSVQTAVAAVDADQLSSSVPAADKETSKKFYFVVANAKFMLDDEEHLQELLFERLRNYAERKIEQDFWLVIEPKFLEKFPDVAKRLKRPAVALVSTNGPWITYMKLRLDRVLSESYEAESLEEALAYNQVDIQFEKPDKWVAPYPKYESGWWERLLPPKSG